MFIERMNKGSWGKIRAFFDLNTEGFTIKGFKLVEGVKGLFVGFPSSRPSPQKDYKDTVWANQETKARLKALVDMVYNSDEGVKCQDNFVEPKSSINNEDDISF